MVDIDFDKLSDDELQWLSTDAFIKQNCIGEIDLRYED